MRLAIKFSVYVFAVICFLSITVKDRTLFSYIYGVISPATVLVQDGVVAAYEYSAGKSREFANKLIDNSIPKVDTVRSKLTAPSRKSSQGGHPSEDIAPDEKEQLDDLIKTYKK